MSAGSLVEGLGNESIVKNIRKGRREHCAAAAAAAVRRGTALVYFAEDFALAALSRAGSTSIARRVEPAQMKRKGRRGRETEKERERERERKKSAMSREAAGGGLADATDGGDIQGRTIRRNER